MTKPNATPIELTERDLMRLALRADVSLGAARNWKRGGSGKRRIVERIERAARELGLIPTEAPRAA